MNISSPFSSLSAAVLPSPAAPQRRPQVEALFGTYERQVVARTNQFFTWLLPVQWAFALVVALVWSPRSWDGTQSSVHPHLLAAAFLGALLTLPPLWLIREQPYDLLTRHVVAIAQMAWSALLIDVTGGRIETHFHVFGSLAFLALYRDWRVLPTATLVVILHHLVGGIWYPEAVYGVPFATVWRTAEHSGWVAFEDIVLIWACLVSRREMWEICLRHDENQQLLGELEQRVRERTGALQAEAREHERTAHELRQSEERYRELIANVPIGIVETARSGQLRLANPRFLDIVGLGAHADLHEVNLADGRMISREEQERFWTLLETQKEVRGFEATFLRPDGRPVATVLNARLRPSPHGGPAICESTVEDVTARNQAAQELEKLHQQLIAASREAGMADVATGVLHNVGNVLTSVNLIIHDVQDRLRSTRLSHLHVLAGHLRDQQHRLAEFLTEDSIGRSLPEFMVKLDQHLQTENQTLVADVDVLRDHCEHIRDIIVAQQQAANLCGLTESLAPAQLVEDALRINCDALGRHGIALQRAFSPTPRVRADRHKVLQILVNLVKNAKDALSETEQPKPQITTRVTLLDPTRVALAVCDNGSGIAEENRSKIFQHGFTTKANGHGFGLHSCVLAAREMAGDLTVTSDGPGRGATFTLILPVAGPAAP